MSENPTLSLELQSDSSILEHSGNNGLPQERSEVRVHLTPERLWLEKKFCEPCR